MPKIRNVKRGRVTPKSELTPVKRLVAVLGYKCNVSEERTSALFIRYGRPGEPEVAGGWGGGGRWRGVVEVGVMK